MDLSTIKTFATKELAEVLARCMKMRDGLSDEERNDTNWLTAEKAVQSNPRVVESIQEDVGGDRLSFPEFQRRFGRKVWDSLYQPFRSEFPLPEPYVEVVVR